MQETVEGEADANEARASSHAESVRRSFDRNLKFLYLFSGKARRSGTIGHYLRMIQKIILSLHHLHDEPPMGVKITEVDILNDAQGQNMVKDEAWDRVAQDIDEKKFDTVMATPPCNTHTRLRHKRNGGPKPLRSMQHQRGFPWLTGDKKQQVEDANLLIERSKETCKRAKNVDTS